jgi:hypothetical protein
MKRKITIILFLNLFVLLFVSCVTSNSAANFTLTETYISFEPTIGQITVSPTSSIPIITENQQNQDISLSIVNSDPKCNFSGEVIELIITYQNLTDTPVTLADYDFISEYVQVRSRALLNPELITIEGERVNRAHKDSYYNNLSSTLTYTLSSNQLLTVMAEYKLPDLVYIGGVSQSLPPGKYFLVLAYFSNSDESNIWSGVVVSNKLEICVETK